MIVKQTSRHRRDQLVEHEHGESTFRLSDDYCGALGAQLDQVRILPDDKVEFFKAARRLGRLLPENVFDALADFGWHSNQRAYLHLKNCPEDRDVGPTPTVSEQRPTKQSFRSELLIASIGEQLGRIVSYRQEHDGELFSFLYPVQENADKLSSESSTTKLDIHTEMAFLKDRSPTYVILYCHRQDHEKKAATTVSSIFDFYDQLTPYEIKILSGDNFHTGIDYSFCKVNGDAGRGPSTAILYGDMRSPRMRLDVDLMVGKKSEDRAVLRNFIDLVREFEKPVYLEPGDLLILDNRYAVHGRTPYTPLYDGTDRLLQRSLVLDSPLVSIDYVAQYGRTISIDFSSYFE